MAKFKGFPGEYFTFFDKLKKNNSKKWFEEHREEYDEFVMHPAREYIVVMGEKLRKIAPEVNAIPKINKSLFKINRDVRFSKDKSPYKTYMGIWLWEGAGKRMESSGFYLHVEDKKVLIDTLEFGGHAEKAGVDFDWEITAVEQLTDRPAKQLMFIPAFLLLFFT